MNYQDYIESRVEMTVTQHLNLYLSESDRETFTDAIKIHDYLGGYYITQHPNHQYQVVIDNMTFTFNTREEAEKYLWDEFLEEEANA